MCSFEVCTIHHPLESGGLGCLALDLIPGRSTGWLRPETVPQQKATSFRAMSQCLDAYSERSVMVTPGLLGAIRPAISWPPSSGIISDGLSLLYIVVACNSQFSLSCYQGAGLMFFPDFACHQHPVILLAGIFLCMGIFTPPCLGAFSISL